MSIELRKRRIATGIAVVAIAFLTLVVALVKYQLVDGDNYKAAAESLAVSSSTVFAPRGEILDCNGNPLVTNKQGNSVVFKFSEFPDAKNQQARNEIIFSLLNLLENNDLEWIDR